MTLTAIPNLIIGIKTSSGATYTTLDGANERMAHCGFFTTPDGATRSVTAIAWAVRSVTTGDDIVVQLEGIDASTGLPSGIISAGASGTETVSTAGYKETALSTPYTITSGTWAAATMKMTNSSKSISIVKCGSYGTVYAYSTPAWICEDITGAATWVKNSLGRPNVALKCSTGEYLIPSNGIITSYGGNSYNLSTASNPRYAGNKINCDRSIRLIGAMLNIDMDQPISIKLVDVDGNVLKGDDTSTDMSVTIDPDYRGATSISVLNEIMFPCPKTLSANTDYYLIHYPESASNTALYYINYNSAALLKQCSGNIPSGWTYCRAVATDAWVWTVVAEEGLCLGAIIDQIDIPAAGGAGGGLPILGGSIVR